ncbi:tripartite tricarboxylate transporter TctB family protein [Hydrogenophaga sp.]|uniref:tripartite tricarboxylate transporter TctB family protein n=1 Tax=Hydrogenophaga sp. TaxID=1904254 RepID=UPI0027301BCB|nr:tripartite tricarboxylate transporter TctB family protein [Hydrogenophaga sp.]MDP2018796.1 tripartite tricarboxylate transporter TctB family protein [Hydrogenophaga sp.]MDP3165025.1 tripartite tricarboxylate transporter TctB family protein [Hydrogenophaga sp.]MDP3811620.1 tripartite tricarboxylate transporter TctB family protein [Hydrogenophaga sp.]
MKLASQKDFFSGLMFTIVGVSFAVGATNFDVGNAARMGPGYFPLLLGVILAVLGTAITVKSLAKGPPGGDPIGAAAWRPLIHILGANLAFGALLVGLPSLGIPAMGLIVGIYALVIIAGRAQPNASFKESLILATILAVGSYGAFVFALKLQFPVWPAFLTH